MIGGRDYVSSIYNRATQAQRQPGSAFKLFVYQAALRQGMTPDSLILDAPVTIGAVAEEFSRCGIDAVGAAAEVDAVEIQLEDLVLAELALERERQDRFLELARDAAVVGEEDVARELLRDGRGGADAVPFEHRRADCPRKADRVHADMAAEAPVFGRDHRGSHLGGNVIVGEPGAEARAHLHQHLAVGGADADHLTEVAALGEVAVARQISRRDRDRDDQAEERKQRRISDAFHDAPEGGPTGAVVARFCHSRSGDRKLLRPRQ